MKKSNYSGILENDSLPLLFSKVKMTAKHDLRLARITLAARIDDSRLLDGLPEAFAASYGVMLDADGPVRIDLPYETAPLVVRFRNLPGEQGSVSIELRPLRFNDFCLEKDLKTGVIRLDFSCDARLVEPLMLFIYRTFGSAIFWSTEEIQGRLLPEEQGRGADASAVN